MEVVKILEHQAMPQTSEMHILKHSSFSFFLFLGITLWYSFCALSEEPRDSFSRKKMVGLGENQQISLGQDLGCVLNCSSKPAT